MFLVYWWRDFVVAVTIAIAIALIFLGRMAQ
jgi:hypothetical protein